MDAKEFGSFIANRRKELGMTQASLADTLHVTDKAVSRWERGIGFPDISSLEDLASALDISIAELMQGKLNENDSISKEDVDKILIDTINITKKSPVFYKIGGTVIVSIFVLIAVAVVCLLLTDFKVLIFPVGCILAGLTTWGIPVWEATIAKSPDIKKAYITSFSFALLSVLIQFMSVANRIRLGDVGGVMDTIFVTLYSVIIFTVITVVINVLMTYILKKKQ